MLKEEVVLKEENLGVFPDWEKVFNRKAPIFLEIGIGNGEFIKWIAEKHPENNYVGVEVARQFFKKAVNRIVSAGLTNVRLIHCEGAKALCQFFENSSLSGLYLNFPDPWAKKKQKHRRLVNELFPWLLALKLMNSGFFLMATDFKEYAEEVVEFFYKTNCFASLWNGNPLRNRLDDYYYTKYARKWLSYGLPLYFVGFKKVKIPEKIPEKVYEYYPILKISKGETMPHSIIQIEKFFNPSEFVEKLPEGIIFQKNQKVIKILEKFLSSKSVLLDSLVSEGHLVQRFFVNISPHSNGLIIKIHDSDKPLPTEGVHTLIGILTQKVLNLLSGKLLKTTCKKRVMEDLSNI